MDPSELLFGPPDLLAEGHRLNHAGDETNYANKDAAARDFEDELSGSEVESEEEVAGAVPEAAANEASRTGQDEQSGATGAETRWARAVAVVKGEAEGPEAFARNGEAEVVPRWSRVFARAEEETEVAGEDAYLEADLQRAREMEERRHGVAHGETVLAIAEEPRVRPGQLEAEVSVCRVMMTHNLTLSFTGSSRRRGARPSGVCGRGRGGARRGRSGKRESRRRC
jgi:hypothetical protein